MAQRYHSPTPPRQDLRGIARRAVMMAANMMNQRISFMGNDEPSLDELMDEPMVRRLMARDGVAEDSLRGMLQRIKGSLERV